MPRREEGADGDTVTLGKVASKVGVAPTSSRPVTGGTLKGPEGVIDSSSVPRHNRACASKESVSLVIRRFKKLRRMHRV